ncbi:MAG: ribonuclease J [bacterium]|nr:ribonuclease J [bacterium]
MESNQFISKPIGQSQGSGAGNSRRRSPSQRRGGRSRRPSPPLRSPARISPAQSPSPGLRSPSPARERSAALYVPPSGGQAPALQRRPKVLVYALGGLEEVGRNCMVFECGDDIVIVDMGLQFPEEDMHGIDYIIPNIISLRGKEKNIRGVIITHGHYDHIGGIPHLLGKLGNPPIFTTPLAAGIIKKRQEEFTKAPPLNIVLIKPKMKIALGRNFVFEPFHVNHNITDSTGAAMHTPYGFMLMTGDFKFDYTPVNEEPADIEHIRSFGDRGVLALFSDSTDAEYPGHQISEQQVFNELEKIFAASHGRLIFGTFSSLLTRIQHILTLSEKYGRRVLIQGRSMVTNVEIAHELGHLKFKQGIFIEEKEFNRLPDNKVTIICTGAQGEKNAQLMRIANNEHRLVSIKKGDAIIFSSSVIPGNERTVQSVKDALIRHGAKIYHSKFMDIHAGGHAKQEELKLMMQLTRARYMIPVHGNRYMLQEHANLAYSIGYKEENVFVSDNGQVMEFDERGGRLTDRYVPTDYVMVDGLGVGDVSEIVLRDRQQLAEDGMFVVIATIDKRTGALIGSPDIISRGFVYLKESRELIERARSLVRKILKDSDPKSPAFDEHIKNKIRNEVGQFLYTMTRRRPMVLPVLIGV